METNIRTDIGGFVFNLSASAYHILEDYFNKINVAFPEEEAREISGDIEFRIAELLKEAGKDTDTIVEEEDINSILSILGLPFEDEAEVGEEPEENRKNGRKPLFRHPEDRYLGGLSAGIALWLNIKPNIVRIAFIVLSLFKGFGLLLYGILWAITPEAKSRTQLLQMQGKAPNLDNLKSSIEGEFKALQNSFSRFSKSDGFKQFPKLINKILSICWRIIALFFKIILFLIGFITLIVTSILLLVFISTLFFPGSIYSPLSWLHGNIDSGIYQWILPAGQAFIFKLGIVLFIGIPVFFILLAALRILFRLPYRHKKIFRISGLFLWFAGLFMLINFGLNEHKLMRQKAQESQSYTLTKLNSDTLYISISEQDYEPMRIGEVRFELKDATWNVKQGKSELIGQARIYMRVAKDSTFSVKEIKIANGANDKKAQKEAQNIDFQWQQKDSLLIIPKYFSLKNKSRQWMLQKMRFYIYVPKGKAVKFLTNIRHQHIYGIDRYIPHSEPQVWVARDDNFVSEYELRQEAAQDSAMQVVNPIKEAAQSDTLPSQTKNEMDNELKEMKQELDKL